MELYIFDRDLNFQGILESFFSLQWIRRYYKCGEFELHCALTPHSLGLLEKENIIYKKGGSEAGYIEYRNIKQDDEGKEILVVKGKFLTGYLSRRIVWNTINIEGNAEIKIKELVNTQCINVEDPKRIIPFLRNSENKGYIEIVNYQVSYKEVLTELEKISKLSNLGFRINFNPSNREIIFDVYKGLDRTINQTENSPCVFSEDFDNVLQQEYIDSNFNYKNTSLIAGEGEGSSRVKVIVGQEHEGLDRYEMFVDARYLAKEELTELQYKELLREQGKSKLSERKINTSFDGNIDTNSNLEYKTDFDLGDLITIINKKWNIKIDTRITEIEEIYEESGLSVNVIFGNNIPTLIDKVKQEIN